MGILVVGILDNPSSCRKTFKYSRLGQRFVFKCCNFAIIFSRVEGIFHVCNSAIIVYGYKLVVTNVILRHFLREEVIFHGWFQRFFTCCIKFSREENLKFYW